MNQIAPETKTLDELYSDAVLAGEHLVVYAGGDTIDQQDDTANAFRARFPKIPLRMIVDYSKFHNARIDFQLGNDTLVPDIAQLQVVHEFPRWKEEGHLFRYKAAGYNEVHDMFKDEDAYWISISANGFAYLYNRDLVKDPPSSATYFLNPELKDKIAANYPNDDDATQFLFMKTIERHGWGWFHAFLQQRPVFFRGGQAAIDAVVAGNKALAFGVFGSLGHPIGGIAHFAVPEADPFMAWGQRAAIFKKARNLNAAKLYLNWWLSAGQQGSWHQWSVRRDVSCKAGYKAIWEYTNVSPNEFSDEMRNRELMERIRMQLTQYIGEPQGPPSAGILGMYPETGH